MSCASEGVRAMLVLAAGMLVLCAVPAGAEVVRPSPDFTWINSAGSTERAAQFRGQPVVLLVAPSARNWTFRRQVGKLQGVFQRLSATGAVCVAAFSGESARIRSNIPFTIVQDGPGLASQLGVEPRRFAIAIIGRDGNLDSFGPEVLSGQRVLDVIGNSYAVQRTLRRD